MTTMYDDLKLLFKSNNWYYIVPSRDSVECIYKIFFNNNQQIIDKYADKYDVSYYYAYYLLYVLKDNVNAEKYFNDVIQYYDINNVIDNPLYYLQSLYQLSIIHNDNNDKYDQCANKYYSYLVKLGIHNKDDINVLTKFSEHYEHIGDNHNYLKYLCALYDLGEIRLGEKIYDTTLTYFNEIYMNPLKCEDAIKCFNRIIEFKTATNKKITNNIIADILYKIIQTYKFTNNQDMIDKYVIELLDFVVTSELFNKYSSKDIVNIGKLYSDEISFYEMYEVKSAYNGVNNTDKMIDIYKIKVSELCNSNNHDIAITYLTRIISDSKNKNLVIKAMYNMTLIHKVTKNKEFIDSFNKYIDYIRENNFTFDISSLVELIYHDNFKEESLMIKYIEQKFPNNILYSLYTSFGDMYLNNKKYDIAELFYTRSTPFNNNKINIGLTKIHYTKGNEFAKMKKYDNAIIEYEKSYNNGNINCANQIGLMYEKLGKLDTAEKYYLIAINNKDYNCASNLADIYINKNNIDKAIELCKNAINNNHNMYEKLSAILLNNNQFDDAFDLYCKNYTKY